MNAFLKITKKTHPKIKSYGENLQTTADFLTFLLLKSDDNAKILKTVIV